MILLSLVLVVGSAAALGWGIATTSDQLVWGSLLAGLAAAALVVGSVLRRRRQPAAPEAPGAPAPPAGTPPSPPAPDRPAPPQAWPWSAGPAGSGVPAGAGTPRSGWTGPVGPPAPAGSTTPAPPPAAETAEQTAATAAVPVGDRPLGEPFPPPAADAVPAAAAPAPDDGEPPAPDDGEPPAEDVPVRDALRVAQLDDTVLVVDGYPRYHLDGCRTLEGAEAVPLPVSAARRAGFTPCGVCRPDAALLDSARARRPAAPPPAPASG